MINETQNSVPKYLSTPERIASELDSIRDRLMTRGIVSGERLYGCDEWSEPVVRLQKVIEALQAPAHDGEVVAWLHTVRDAKARDGDTDLALSFDDHSFPLDSIGWVSIKAQPLYTAPPRVADFLSLVTKWEARAGEIGNYTQERTAASAAIRDCADQLQAALEKQ